MEKYMTLDKLSELLQLKDKRSVKVWCEKRHIPLVSCAKQQLVDSFLVEVELEKGFVSHIKAKYPSNWEALYNLYRTKDMTGYQSLLTQLEQKEIVPKCTPIINP